MFHTIEDYIIDVECSFCGWIDGEHASGCPYQDQEQEPACPKCSRILKHIVRYIFGDPNLGIASELWKCECGFSTTDINKTRR